MKSNESAQPRPASWAGPVALLATGGAAGLGLWQAQSAFVPWWLVVGLLTLTAVLGGVWLYRIRAARDFVAALDAYAERELARAKRQPHLPSVNGNRAGAKQRLLP